MWYNIATNQEMGKTKEEAFENACAEMDSDYLIGCISENTTVEEVLDLLYQNCPDLFYEHFAEEIAQAQNRFFTDFIYPDEDEEEEEG